MPTAIGSIVGALFVIYNTLPLLGVNVPVLTPEHTGGASALIVFLVGLFTKHPGTPPTGSIQAVDKAAAEYENKTGQTYVPPMAAKASSPITNPTK